MAVFTLDGIEYDVNVMELKRSFAVTDTTESGRTIDGAMHRDIIGTFYNYTITIDCRNLNVQTYDSLFENLSAPVTSHDLKVPYGQDTLEFAAYITSGEDELKILDGKNVWSGLVINFVAMEPQRRP